ncbi:hypothetical protein AV654_31080 [Paenibacillus elgii]|uniref:Ger(X)C family spore germination protein n=1 Tax=Paenibacillus elgii TaxID=189691 RepID=A0A163UXM6_9BACL|nr:Ger(x)C family spore germination protein [Paenibacillus elgii]KZE74017.1 hypothetical protein AV654_31080 [Paenibacillus elgii]
MRRHPWLQLMLILPPLLLLSACGMRSVEQVIYPNAIGIDYVKGQYKVYVQVIDFTNIAKVESGGRRANPSNFIGEGTASTFDEAIFQVYRTSHQSISWSHISSIVFSKAVLEHGITDVMDLWGRFNEFRQTPWVFGTDRPMREILSANPILNISMLYSQLSSPTDIYRQSSFIQPLRLYHFMSTLYEPGMTSLLPSITINEKAWTKNTAPHKNLMMDGVYGMKKDKLVAVMPSKDLLGFRWMNRSTSRGVLALGDPKQPTAVVVMQKPKAVISPVVQQNRVSFNIEVSTSGGVFQYNRPMDEKEIQRQAEQKIKEEIEHTYRKGLERKMDVLQLSDALYRQDPKKWRKLAQKNEFFLNKDSLQSVKVKVRMDNSQKLKLKRPSMLKEKS